MNEENTEKKAKINFKDMMEDLSHGGKYLVITVVVTFILLILACLVVFFASVQGAEQVMVPDVTGKPLTTALLEMQAKELYPKIQLRYSESEGDEGLVLAQDPKAGAIVKAYRRITLTVSRGIAIDSIGDYTGQTYSSVKTRIENVFSGDTPLVTVSPPVYITSTSPSGTILAQFPQEGTQIVTPVTLTLIVSEGDEPKTTKVPSLVNKSFEDVIKTVSSSSLVFNFKSVDSEGSLKPGMVASQDTEAGTEVSSYSRIDVEMAVGNSADNKVRYGIYSNNLEDYPFPVPVKLEEVTVEGTKNTIISINHPGSELTLPYKANAGSTLNLYVLDQLLDSKVVE